MGVVGELLGHVPKAVLYVRQYDMSYFQLLLAETSQKALEEVMIASNAAMDEAELGLLAGGGSGMGMARDVATAVIRAGASIAGFTSMKVQYNPSSIYLDTSAGTLEIDNGKLNNMLTNQITQINTDAITTLGVQLIFDDMNQMDAFGADASMLSTGGAAALIGEAVRKKKYSVRKPVEGLMGCLLSPITRRVIFCWSDMIFSGEINQVNANYTMFNKSGEPIRATVDLVIQQTSGSTKDEKGGYWDKAFTKAFGKAADDAKIGGKNAGQKLANNSFMNLGI